MTEYIDRNILFEQIRLTANRSCLGETSVAEISAMEIVNVIANMPVADVEPVKHGEWVNNDDEWKFYKCSICRNEAYWDTDYGQQLFDFCPWCGAKMDGESND